MSKWEKGYGFYASRKQGRRSSLPPRWRWFLALLAAAALWMLGMTPLLPQSSELLSSSSSSDLMVWETLSQRFQTGLDEQLTLLQQALEELQTSRANTQQLTLLLEQSLQANNSLKVYSERTTARLKELNDELSQAHETINRLERKVNHQIRAILGLLVVVVLLLVVLIIMGKIVGRTPALGR